MDARRKEIRKLLTGYLTPAGDGVAAAEHIRGLVFQGFYAGSLSARLFGLKVRRRQFRLKESKSRVEELVYGAFLHMGRAVYLKSAPDAMAVLCYPLLHNPCVMTAEFAEHDVLICFYTARTLRAPINALRRFREWKKRMAADMTETKVSIPCQILDSSRSGKGRQG